MKQFLTIFFLMFLTWSVKGQENGLQSKLLDKAHTQEFVSNEIVDSFYFNLQPVGSLDFKTYIRIALPSQTVNLYSTNGKAFEGDLINYTIEHRLVKAKRNEDERHENYQYIFEKISLNSTEVNNIVQKYLASKQHEMPSDSLVVGWNKNFLHCNTVEFQFNINGKYLKQSFDCLQFQNENMQSKSIVLANYGMLMNRLKLDSIYGLFFSKLPKGRSYDAKSGYGSAYKLTDKQIEWWNKSKPEREYLESIKDTIDSHIETALAKQKIQLNGISCFETYHLVFGTNGKLKKINIYDRPKLKNGIAYYFEDQSEIRKCKKKIKEIFQEIDLSSINLKYEVSRVLSFDHEDNYLFRDETMY